MSELPLTESTHPDSRGLDRLSSRELVDVLHRADREVRAAFNPDALENLAAIVERVGEGFKAGGRLIYVGAGTSGRLGVLDASECPPTFSAPPGQVVGVIAGGERALRESIEGAEDDPEAGARALEELDLAAGDFVCGIAASGTTPFVIGALERARQRGASTALITCNRVPVERRRELPVDHLVELLVGPEVLAGSTRLKAGTATKMALNMISTGAMVRLGKVYDNRMIDLRPVNDKLRRRAARLIAEIGSVEPERARELLELSGGGVKVAIVMARLQLSRSEAEALLQRHAGLLHAVLEGPRG